MEKLSLFTKSLLFFLKNYFFDFQKGLSTERLPTFFRACILALPFLLYPFCPRSSKKSVGEYLIDDSFFVFSKTNNVCFSVMF